MAENLFQKALEKRQKMEKEKEAKKNRPSGGSGEFEEFNYCALESEVQAGFRILGVPFEMREKPTDPKLILLSNILNEAGNSYLKIYWPYKEKDGRYEPDPSWILTKMYNKVTEGKWKKFSKPVFDEERGKEVTGEFEHTNKNTKIFQKLKSKFGNSKEGEKYPKNFYPSSRVVLNCIDRLDSFCEDNKHSKLLSSKVSVYEKDGNTSVFADIGIPYTLYTQIFDTYVNYGGDWNKCDALVIKKEKKYEVASADEPKRIMANLKGKVIDGELTEEELQYELYDLDKFFSPSSYRKLKDKLGFLFKLCDAELKTNFYDELEKLVEKEQAEWEAKQEVKENKEISKKDESKTSAPEKTERRESKKETSSSEPSEEVKKYFTSLKYWGELSKKEQDLILGSVTTIKDKVPQYKRGLKVLACSNETTCLWPGTAEPSEYNEEVTRCPICNEVFPVED